MGLIRVYCLVLFITLRANYTKGVRECVDGEVRLEDGEGDHVGRVVLCYRGQWGSVSQDHINERVARVVCRQLELPSHDPKVVMQYAGAKGPVHLSHVVCSGNESSLLECHHREENGRGPGSWFGRDIGVSCAPPCREGEVRLLRNRVQTCHNQVWGYICFSPDTWTHQSARVVCRELGLTSEEALADHEGFHKTFFPHFANLTNCTGSEGRLSDCPQSYNQKRCGSGYYHAAKAYCSGIERCPGNETVRLGELGGSMGSNVGRLEICYNGYWQSICSHNATGQTSAIVACRELSYSNLLKATFTPIGLYDVILPNIPILWEGLQCHGYERSLSDCPRHNDLHNCINWEDVVLHCRVRECNETDVRLVGGQSAAEGAVQICQNGLWVSVCDTRWDYRGAEIVCRQLGYHGSVYALREHVGSLQESLIMSSTVVECRGENTLSECWSSEQHECRAKAAILCTDASCTEDALRLVGGHSMKEGRVQVCHSGEWHSVCADSWSETGAVETSVLCSKLGFSGDTAMANFGRELAPTLSLDIGCNGAHDESCNITHRSSLGCQEVAGIVCEAHCVSVGVDFCSECSGPANCPVNDVCYCSAECFDTGHCCPDVEQLLTCLPNDGCEPGEVRLVGGVANSSSGVVELCVGGVWGTICDSNHEWSHDNAAVVCRQLNHPVDNADSIISPGEFDSASGRPVLLDSVHCTGSEASLLGCPHASLGNHLCSDFIYHAAVFCKDDCEDGDMRLEGASSGRVEICWHGMWGSVCSDDMWDAADARVVCRQLGFESQDVEAIDVIGSVGPILMADVKCTGYEAELYNCTSDRLISCEERGRRAGVRCINGALGGIKVNEGTGSVRVSWDSVTGADMYTVTLSEAMRDNQQGPCRQSSNKPISVDTTNTSVSIDKPKLRAYTTYSITVTVESDLSNSSHETILFIFTTQQNGSSVTPRNVRASFVNSTVITVQWDGLTPCTQVNGRIVKYRVWYTAERSDGEVGTEDKAGEWDVTGAELALNGLRPHTNYSIRVAAVNQEGDLGLYSDPITIQTAEDVPGAVVGLKHSPSNGTNERISLTWSPPLRPNGVLIAYEVSYRPTDSSQPHHTRRNTTHLATSFTTGELEMGTEYNLSVRAYTSAGPGQSSSVVFASTLESVVHDTTVTSLTAGKPTSNVSRLTAVPGSVATSHHIEIANTTSLSVKTGLNETASSTTASSKMVGPDSTVPDTESQAQSTILAVGGVLAVFGIIAVTAGTVAACVKVRTARSTAKAKNIATEENPAYAQVSWNKKRPSHEANADVKTEDNPAYVTCRGRNTEVSAANSKPASGDQEEVVYEMIPI